MIIEELLMSLMTSSKCYRFPISIISHVVWLYHRFNHSLRDVSEQLAFRGMSVSHEAIRMWGIKFSRHFKDIISKQERKFPNKWHLDEGVQRVRY